MLKSSVLPSARYYKTTYPLTKQLAQIKRRLDNKVKNALIGNKFLIVVGPCSADSIGAINLYANKLSNVVSQLSDNVVVAMRVFTAKPRTDGDGYQGVLFHQIENQLADIADGIAKCRQMMLNTINLQLPVADELLYPDSVKYYGDLVSYYSLGARSSMDPLHRGFASGLNIPVGVKNSIDGDLIAMVKGVYAVSRPKVFPYGGKQISTDGNSYVHAILRGYHDGSKFVSNIDCASEVAKLYKQFDIKHGFVIVDCSHANSAKVAECQIDNALHCAKDKNIGGVMLESYLYKGQAKDALGVSKTDECLDFETTANLLKEIDNIVSKRK